MDNNDLLSRQREALLVFRQAGKERQAAERQARHDLDDVEKKATHQQKVAQTQLEAGRNWLRKANLEHLLQKEASTFAAADTDQAPREELAHWVERAQQAAAAVEASVRAKLTFQEAVDAASRAERHAKDAKESAARAKVSSEQANRAWESIKQTLRWKAASYFGAKVEAAMDEAAKARRQAESAAHETEEAAKRSRSSLSFSDSVAVVAEAQARTAAQRAAGEAKTARQAANEAEQAAGKAIDAARAAKRTWWRRTLVAIAIAILAMVAAYFLIIEPEAGYQAAVAALETGDWQQAQHELDSLKGRSPFWRDMEALQYESHYQAAAEALEARDWETSRNEIRQVGGTFSQDAQKLLRDSYFQEAALSARAQQWQAGAKAIIELYRLERFYEGLADLLDDYPELLSAVEASVGPLWPPDGRWEGTVTQGSSNYSVVLVLSNCARQEICGSTSYAELSCRGSLSFEGIQKKTFLLTERITEGKDRCINTVLIKLTPGSAGNWYYHTEYSNATLTKTK